MPKIQVPPELLIQVAEKFRLQSLQMEWMISSLDHQMNTMLMWEGTTRQRFFEDFHRARSEMNRTIEYMNSISDELKRIAHRFILVDEELLPLALLGRTEEPKTWLEKAWGSLKEIGNGIMDASNERYVKRYSSVWGFLDYWTAGIPKGAYQGYVERANKLFDSPNDFADGMTFGIHGTIREAILPTKAWSTEHVASIIGAAGIATGATVPLMKPKDILSPRVKYEVRKGNEGLKRDAGGDGGGAPKADEPGDVAGVAGRNLIDNPDEIAQDIIDINKKYANGVEMNNSVRSIINSASYYENSWEQVSAVTRSIADHAFADGNKRSAFDTMNMLLENMKLKSPLSEAQKWDLIVKMGKGEIKDVSDIASILKGD